MPKVCPECGSRYVKGFKAGTEAMELHAAKAFPGARILRMDADTTRTKGSYERILETFSNGDADILIGTQMIVKGHDFPGQRRGHGSFSSRQPEEPAEEIRAARS